MKIASIDSGFIKERIMANGNSKIGKLVAAYQEAREKLAKVEIEVKSIQDQIKIALGDTEEIVVSGFKVTYRHNWIIDAERLRSERPSTFTKYVKEPELDVARFRKEQPVLADQYAIKSTTRPLSIRIA
jgi:predicted phage-related endonuclease